MRRKTVNINDAKARLSSLVARAERGERIIIARAGNPVAELGPVSNRNRSSSLLDDPLLRVHEYSYDGPIGPMTNRDIDNIVCASSRVSRDK